MHAGLRQFRQSGKERLVQRVRGARKFREREAASHASRVARDRRPEPVDGAEGADASARDSRRGAFIAGRRETAAVRSRLRKFR